MRKPVFGVSDQVRHKPGCRIKEDGQMLVISVSGSGGIVLWSTIRVAKTKALISFAVTAKLICVFVFAYAKPGFLLTRLNDLRYVLSRKGMDAPMCINPYLAVSNLYFSFIYCHYSWCCTV